MLDKNVIFQGFETIPENENFQYMITDKGKFLILREGSMIDKAKSAGLKYGDKITIVVKGNSVVWWYFM